LSVRNIRRGFWLLLRLMVVTSVVFALLGGWAWLERSYIYPYDYRSYIEMSAARHHTDPYLVAALIKHESKFGNAPAHRLFDLVHVDKADPKNQVAREFGDYTITIDEGKLPQGVEIRTYDYIAPSA